MALKAPDIVTLRKLIQEWLWDNIPEEVSSKDNGRTFTRLTGMTQASLEANWKGGGMLTSCNSFAGTVMKEIGVSRGSVLAKGVLDISLADKEVPGCWQEANSAEACMDNITPHPGDLYSGWFKGKYKGKDFFQKWGHVGIVYSYEPDTGMWWLVQGGQGGPGQKQDFIRWKYAKFDRTKINGWVDVARHMMPNGPYAINDSDSGGRAAIDEYSRP
jgi:hypothetical protein